jgi:hypothetical protein
MPGQHDDQTLLLADVARKALHQVQVLLERMLEERLWIPRVRERSLSYSPPESGRTITRCWRPSWSSSDSRYEPACLMRRVR